MSDPTTTVGGMGLDVVNGHLFCTGLGKTNYVLAENIFDRLFQRGNISQTKNYIITRGNAIHASCVNTSPTRSGVLLSFPSQHRPTPTQPVSTATAVTLALSKTLS